MKSQAVNHTSVIRMGRVGELGGVGLGIQAKLQNNRGLTLDNYGCRKA